MVELKIVELLKRGFHMTAKEIAIEIGCSPIYVYRPLKKLVKNGDIHTDGAVSNATYWIP